MMEPEREEVWECEVCGADCDPYDAYCSDECEREASVEDGEPESSCNHSHHEWRNCADCKAAYGDLQYQRMKEGDL